MADQTNIEWCDSTFNPWMGCTKVSPACDHCYAEALVDTRWHKVQWGSGQQRQRTSAANWAQPKAWQRGAPAFMAQHGRRRRVFSASLADWLDNAVPIAWLVDLLQVVHATPDLDWLLLSKRIGNWADRISEAIGYLDEQTPAAYPLPLRAWLAHWLDGDEAPRNVWLGATVVNQAEADRDVPKLLRVPAVVRFASIEPMLAAIDVRAYMWPVHPRWPARFKSPAEAIQAGAEVTYHRQALLGAHVPLLNWMICGGESGPKARPMHPDWARSLRDQCAAAGVPFLFKQWGEFTAGEPVTEKCSEHDQSAWRRDQRGQAWNDPNEAGKPRDQLTPVKFIKVGKKAAGRLLDGCTHDGFPGTQC